MDRVRDTTKMYSPINALGICRRLDDVVEKVFIGGSLHEATAVQIPDIGSKDRWIELGIRLPLVIFIGYL